MILSIGGYAIDIKKHWKHMWKQRLEFRDIEFSYIIILKMMPKYTWKHQKYLDENNNFLM